MAWGTSNRRQRLPSNWPALRVLVLQRDGYQCVALLVDGVRCTEPATDVDHIKAGEDHSLINLQALCSWHHARKSAREGHEANRAKARPVRRRAEASHPAEL